MSLPAKIPPDWLNVDVEVALGGHLVDQRTGKLSWPTILRGQITQDIDEGHCEFHGADGKRLLPKGLVVFAIIPNKVQTIGADVVPASKLVTGR